MSDIERVLLVTPANRRDSVGELGLRDGQVGLDVVEVATPAEARAAFADATVDVALVLVEDAAPGGMQGLREVIAVASPTPVVALLREHDEHLVPRALDAGAQDFLILSPGVGLIVSRVLNRAVRYKQVELGLRVRNAELESIFRARPDFFFRLSADGEILDFRAERPGDLYVPPSEFLGKRMQDVLPPSVGELFNDAIVQLRDGQLLVQFQYELDVPAGVRQFEARVVPVLEEEFVILVRDVTMAKLAEEERAKMEQQMRESERLASLGSLAEGVAHDFTNLLTTMLVHVEMAHDTVPQNEAPVRDTLHKIERLARRASEICSQMRALAGTETSAAEPVDVNAVIEDMADLLDVAVSKALRLERDFEAGLPSIRVNVAQLRQLVMNLIINAAEAVGDGDGGVMLRTRLVSEPLPSVCLEVADAGIGMDTETKARMFDPSFSKKSSGRGIGLAMVRRIVDDHGGSIDVESQPGSGTEIRVFLPVC